MKDKIELERNEQLEVSCPSSSLGGCARERKGGVKSVKEWMNILPAWQAKRLARRSMRRGPISPCVYILLVHTATEPEQKKTSLYVCRLRIVYFPPRLGRPYLRYI